MEEGRIKPVPRVDQTWHTDHFLRLHNNALMPWIISADMSSTRPCPWDRVPFKSRKPRRQFHYVNMSDERLRLTWLDCACVCVCVCLELKGQLPRTDGRLAA